MYTLKLISGRRPHGRGSRTINKTTGILLGVNQAEEGTVSNRKTHGNNIIKLYLSKTLGTSKIILYTLFVISV